MRHRSTTTINWHLMVSKLGLLMLTLYSATLSAGAPDQIVTLAHETPAGLVWPTSEKQYYSEIWETEVITNVSTPTLEIFLPDPALATGTGVIVAPGGGLYAHSISSEGHEVARWLAAKGIAAFVLKYRLVPTGDDGVAELDSDGEQVLTKVKPLLPLAVADGLAAIDYVRNNAERLGVAINKIGFMGFSAGGAVTMGVTYGYGESNRPDFIVPVYAWMNILTEKTVPQDAPPMLVVCASDDPLGFAPHNVALYSSWLEAGKSAALHMYAKGGHGFGMRAQGLPSDRWIERFYEWAIAEKFVTLAP